MSTASNLRCRRCYRRHNYRPPSDSDPVWIYHMSVTQTSDYVNVVLDAYRRRRSNRRIYRVERLLNFENRQKRLDDQGSIQRYELQFSVKKYLENRTCFDYLNEPIKGLIEYVLQSEHQGQGYCENGLEIKGLRGARYGVNAWFNWMNSDNFPSY